MKALENIIDQMIKIVDILSPEELHKINKQVKSINESLNYLIDHSSDVLTLDNDLSKHTYYVNNMYAKAQLSKLVPEHRIQVSPDIELGTIVIVKQY